MIIMILMNSFTGTDSNDDSPTSPDHLQKKESD